VAEHSVENLREAAVGADPRSRELGLVDELTGLLNGDALLFLGEYQLKLARRVGRSFALLCVVIEEEEEIREPLGSEAELALSETAQLLLSNFRSSDVCAHLGGGEFFVLLSDVSRSRVGPQIACLRLLDRLEEMKLEGRFPFPVTLRTGVASFGPDDDVTFAELVAYARGQAQPLTRGLPNAGRSGAPSGRSHFGHGLVRALARVPRALRARVR
jgi:diguanylate cyclase (GGDEF)-like protein